jgi:hypothetical protein
MDFMVFKVRLSQKTGTTSYIPLVCSSSHCSERGTESGMVMGRASIIVQPPAVVLSREALGMEHGSRPGMQRT